MTVPNQKQVAQRQAHHTSRAPTIKKMTVQEPVPGHMFEAVSVREKDIPRSQHERLAYITYALFLRYGLTERQIAQHTKLPVQTIKRRFQAEQTRLMEQRARTAEIISEHPDYDLAVHLERLQHLAGHIGAGLETIDARDYNYPHMTKEYRETLTTMLKLTRPDLFVTQTKHVEERNAFVILEEHLTKIRESGEQPKVLPKLDSSEFQESWGDDDMLPIDGEFTANPILPKSM